MQTASFLIDLDCLLDTRVGTCYRLNYALGQAMLKSKQYAFRKHDYFAKDAKYQKLYALRDRLTLQKSTATCVLKLLEELLQGTEQEPVAGPGDFEISIYLNTYPYQLSPEELSAFESVIYTYFPQLTAYKQVYLSKEALTPEWLLNNKVECLVRYDWQDWLEHHESWLVQNPQPLLHLVGPRLRKYEPDFIAGEDTTQFTKLLDNEAEFDMAEFGVQAYIALRTVPAPFFNSFICEQA